MGPVIVSRPAVPHWPAAGMANAAKLNGCPGAAASTGSPVASARTLPVMPVPVVVERTPPTMGVSGVPLPTERLLVTLQSLNTAAFHPFSSAPPPRPVPELYRQ